MIVDYRNIDVLESFSQLEKALKEVPQDKIIKVLLDNNFVQEQVEEFLIIRKVFYVNESKEDYELILVDKFSKKKRAPQKKESKKVVEKEVVEKEAVKKILCLNNDFIGTAENGRSLLLRFLQSFALNPQKFKYIILLNNAVKIASLKGHISHQALKDLEKSSIILSSQSCLEYYNLLDKLSIGKAAKIDELNQIFFDYEVLSL